MYAQQAALLAASLDLQQPPVASLVLYAPLASSPLSPDGVLLFVSANQTLILSEATQQVENQNAPAMGRPACASLPSPEPSSKPTPNESRPSPRQTPY
jgi:hypothetical protein